MSIFDVVAPTQGRYPARHGVLVRAQPDTAAPRHARRLAVNAAHEVPCTTGYCTVPGTWYAYNYGVCARHDDSLQTHTIRYKIFVLLDQPGCRWAGRSVQTCHLNGSKTAAGAPGGCRHGRGGCGGRMCVPRALVDASMARTHGSSPADPWIVRTYPGPLARPSCCTSPAQYLLGTLLLVPARLATTRRERSSFGQRVLTV